LNARDVLGRLQVTIRREELSAKTVATIEKEASELGIPTSGRSIVEVRNEIDATRIADRQTFISDSELDKEAKDALIDLRKATAERMRRLLEQGGVSGITQNQILGLMNQKSREIFDSQLPRAALFALEPTTDPVKIQQFLADNAGPDGIAATSIEALIQERAVQALLDSKELLIGQGAANVLGDLGGLTEPEVPVASEDGEPLPRF